MTEAASHLATNVCKSYLDPLKNNPLSPLPLHTKRRSRFNTDTDPCFLDPTKEMTGDRCSRCHRYKRDPPTSETGHDGSQAESKCRLEHHPFPCDFVDGDGVACSVQADSEKAAEVERKTEAARKTEDLEVKLGSQSKELDEMKRQMDEMRQMMNSMRLPADTRASLSPSNVAIATAHSGVAPTVTTNSNVTPVPSVLQPNQSVGNTGHADLVATAQSLIQRNERSDGAASNHLPPYNGPLMKDIQQDKLIAAEVQKQLDSYISQIPGLQKVVAGVTVPLSTPNNPHQARASKQHQQSLNHGTNHAAYQAIHSGAGGLAAGVSDHPGDDINLLDMDSMLGLTVREKQYRPHEFASRGNFFYARNINDRNITLPLYMYGYLKHCIILLSGLVPVAEGEVMARLINLMNICEITSNNSTLNDFDHPAWQLGRGYGDRVLNDIQQGLRSWPDMPNHILPDVFLHVKDMVDTQSKKKDVPNTRGGGGRGKRAAGGQARSSSDRPGGAQGGEKPLVCTSYNDFFSGPGCAYEFNNQRKCTYEHFCSKCFAATGTKVAHKGRFCTGTSAAVTPAVSTSSG